MVAGARPCSESVVFTELRGVRVTFIAPALVLLLLLAGHGVLLVVVHSEGGVGSVPEDPDCVPLVVTEARARPGGADTEYLGSLATVEAELNCAECEGEVEEVTGVGLL